MLKREFVYSSVFFFNWTLESAYIDKHSKVWMLEVLNMYPMSLIDFLNQFRLFIGKIWLTVVMGGVMVVRVNYIAVGALK